MTAGQERQEGPTVTGQQAADTDTITAMCEAYRVAYAASWRASAPVTTQADAVTAENAAVRAGLTAALRLRHELNEAHQETIRLDHERRLADLARVRAEDDIAWFAIRSSVMEQMRQAVREVGTVRRARKETRP